MILYDDVFHNMMNLDDGVKLGHGRWEVGIFYFFDARFEREVKLLDD